MSGHFTRTAAQTCAIIGALALLCLAAACADAPTSDAPATPASPVPATITPFTDVAPAALTGGYQIWNDRPGVAVFDYDRDGDMDFYITSRRGEPNRLYRNDGGGEFADVAAQAGVDAVHSNSTGVVACDVDNDGFQDLYVGAWGVRDDRLGFRSPQQGNADALYLNNGNGRFTDVTRAAFGDAVNIRSATGIACADINNDGWLDIYVGNLLDDDFRVFADYHHPGHYNLLYLNNADGTFAEIARQAGVAGQQIRMLNPDGAPVTHTHAATGATYEGYNPDHPDALDALGNPVGEPTGQTHAVAFTDYDQDGDADLIVANDGDRLHIYRNDTDSRGVKFTSVARQMGLDIVGSWMGFAIGDYDADADLDIFVTNAGFHPLLMPIVEHPRGNCEYSGRFAWGACEHFLLRNDGARGFTDVAPATHVAPSPWMPPASLDAGAVNPAQHPPTGLAAYDFGFGATFLDYDNDGYQDLYWLGSTVNRGEGPGGQVFPAAGRMLRNNGGGGFEDITVRARLLDISRVNYEGLEHDQAARENPVLLRVRRIDPSLHENGKGVAHADLNADGYTDLIATNSSGEVFSGPFDPVAGARPTQLAPGPLFVWLNGGGSNNWLTLRLKGRMALDGAGSNADAIGARAYITTRVDDAEHTQAQEVIAGSSYLSMDALDLEFGLGGATRAERIQIVWPSGRQQTLENVDAGQILEIVEPEE